MYYVYRYYIIIDICHICTYILPRQIHVIFRRGRFICMRFILRCKTIDVITVFKCHPQNPRMQKSSSSILKNGESIYNWCYGPIFSEWKPSEIVRKFHIKFCGVAWWTLEPWNGDARTQWVGDSKGDGSGDIRLQISPSGDDLSSHFPLFMWPLFAIFAFGGTGIWVYVSNLS